MCWPLDGRIYNVEPPISDFRYLTDCYICDHVSFSNKTIKADYVRPCPKCKSYKTVTYDRIANLPIHTMGHLRRTYVLADRR